MKRFLLLFAAMLACVSPAAAQTVTVSAANVHDIFGNKLASGQACFLPTDNSGTPMSFKDGGGGQVSAIRKCVSVANGAFSATLSDTSLTNPANVCYQTTVKDTTNGTTPISSGYECVQPTASNYWCTSGACNFDTYTPAGTPNVVQVAGPTGPQGPAGVGVSTAADIEWIGKQTFDQVPKEARAPQNLVAAGDSISHGNQVLLGDEWPSQVMNLPMFRERGTLTNTAVVGYTCANMTSDYVTKVQPLRPSVTGVPTLLSTLIGRNNFSGGNTAATVEACISAYWAQARTDGFKIIAFTVYDTTGIVSETERNAYNTWVKANGSLYDYLVDTDAAFPSFTDTTLISDQIHPTARGHNLIANLANAAVGGVSNFPTTPKSEVQAAAIVRAPIFSAEPSVTAAGSVFAYNLTTLMNRGSYERGVLFWNANVWEIGTEMVDGSGFGLVGRSTRLKSANDIKFASAGTDWWQLRTNGALYCITDGTCDVGQATNNRPNNVSAKNIVDAIFLRAYNSAGGPGEADVFNTVDSITAPVNFSRTVNKWVANTNAVIGTEAGGTGTVYPLHIRVGTDKWSVETSGSLVAITDNSYDIGASGASRPRNIFAGTTVNAPTYQTTTNCSSSASPAVCSSASAGNMVIAAAATTVTVNTTAVTANSQIFLQEDSSLGTKLGVTCNTTLGRGYTITARTAGTSFVITTSAAPTTNPACLSYRILN